MTGGGPAGDYDFEGKVAVVTGGTQGLGRQVVCGLHRAGASVVAVARRQSGLDALTEMLGGEDRLATVAKSLTDPDFAEAVADAAGQRFGSVGLVVNNAAISPIATMLDDTDSETFAAILNANVVQPWRLVTALRRLGLQSGSIVNVGTIGGIEPVARFGPYGTSKAALHHLTKQMALEFAPGVRVNAIAPAVFESAFSAPLFEGGMSFEHYPLRRAGTSEEVADAVLFMLSDRSSWITGQVLVVDGGFTVRGG